MAAYGHDRRRRLSIKEMRLLYARAGSHCRDCGTALDASWHNAHMAAYVTGGAIQIDRLRAQCRKCNLQLGPRDMEQVEDLHLSLWEQQASEPIVNRLWSAGSATLHAAPGARKTPFIESRLGRTDLRSLDVNSLFYRFRKTSSGTHTATIPCLSAVEATVLTCSRRRPSSGRINRRG